MAELLKIENLSIGVKENKKILNIVNRISFSLEKGSVTGLVGESGCGKSLTAMSILQLIKPPLVITNGNILFRGEDLLSKSGNEIRHVRGKDISMIFQEPMTSLSPLVTVGEQIAETIRLHEKIGRTESLAKACELLHKVGINSPKERLKQFPYELSGGMRQRVMIAIALSCRSILLIADEPTTALDVTIQAQILELLKKLNKDIDMTILLITHDLGVVAETCRDVVVLYAGQVVEKNSAYDIFSHPLHPYTEVLLESIPKISEKKDMLASIPGNVPSPGRMPGGCRLHPRCSYADERCRIEVPPLYQVREKQVRCFRYE